MTSLGPVVRDAASGLRRNLTMALAVVLCTAVSLALLGVGLLAQRQVGITSAYLSGRVELAIFLTDTITPDERGALQSALTTDPAVQHLDYESKNDAYAKYRTLFADSPELLDGVTAADLPASFHVKLRDPRSFAVVAQRYRGRPGIDSVQDWRKQLDVLFKVLNGVQFAAFALAAVLGLATLVLLFNTIRVAAHTRRREMRIMRLVGASNVHIAAPFVLESAAAGLLGGVVAGVALYAFRVGVVDDWLQHQHFTPPVSGRDVWVVIAQMVVAGLLLGAGMAVLALRRNLRAAEARSFLAGRREVRRGREALAASGSADISAGTSGVPPQARPPHASAQQAPGQHALGQQAPAQQAPAQPAGAGSHRRT